MRAWVAYATPEEPQGRLEFDIPDEQWAGAVVPSEPDPLGDPVGALEAALRSPVVRPPWGEMLAAGKKVVFIVENQFRAAPASLFLPVMVHKALAAGCSVSLVVANGKVPPPSPEEIAAKVGPEVAGLRLPTFTNTPLEAHNYVFKGITSRGTPVWVLRSVAEADVRVAISTCQATLWGYGGSGMIIPGVAANETIELNHVAALAPDCLPGNNECSMQLDKYEAARLAGLDFQVNVIVDNLGRVIFVNAGEPVASHRRAVAFYDGVYRFSARSCGAPVDVVVVGSSAPTDHLFFHTGWALVNVLPLLKKGGGIVFCSPCPGYGDWPGFALMDLMKELMPPSAANLERALRMFYTRERELWAGCIWFKIYCAMLDHPVYLVTRSENVKMAREVGFWASDSLSEALEVALAQHGPRARVCVVPYGRYLVFD